MTFLPLLFAIIFCLSIAGIAVTAILLFSSHLSMRQRQRDALRSFIPFRQDNP